MVTATARRGNELEGPPCRPPCQIMRRAARHSTRSQADRLTGKPSCHRGRITSSPAQAGETEEPGCWDAVLTLWLQSRRDSHHVVPVVVMMAVVMDWLGGFPTTLPVFLSACMLPPAFLSPFAPGQADTLRISAALPAIFFILFFLFVFLLHLSPFRSLGTIA